MMYLAYRALLSLAFFSSIATAQSVTLPGAEQFSLRSVHTGKSYQIYLSKPIAPPPAGGYPVLFALDGDISFPALHLNNPRSTQALQRMAQHGPKQPDAGVIVGIGYGLAFDATLDLRASDYPAACLPCDSQSAELGGAERFARFIDEELRPEIAKRLPINPQRQSLLGHSYGGLFTLYHFLSRQQQPQGFQQYFAISPSLWFANRALLRSIKPQIDQAPAKPVLLALWAGGDEEPLTLQGPPARLQRLQQNRMLSNMRELSTQLQGSPGVLIEQRIIADHDHGQIRSYALDRVPALAFSPYP